MSILFSKVAIDMVKCFVSNNICMMVEYVFFPQNYDVVCNLFALSFMGSWRMLK